MANPRTVGASLVIVGVLGAQLLAVVRHRNDATLFPFLAYPMYATAATPGRTYV